MNTSSRGFGDDVLVRRAARGVAIQVAGLVSLAIVVLVTLATLVVVQGQADAANRLLRSTANSADDVVDPPPNSWLILFQNARLTSSPGLPVALLPRLQGLRNGADLQLSLTNISTPNDRHYRVASQRRADGTIQVVLDLTSENHQRSRLLLAMGSASGFGLIFAMVLGVFIGRRAVRPLGQALALQRTFIADASHELRTPLTLLSTRAQVLERSLRTSDCESQVLADSHGVVEDVARLAELVEDLLLAADPLNEESRSPTDLHRVVAEVVESASAHAAEVDVTVHWDGGQDHPGWVLASAPALRRAVLTLVDNAIDHTPAGGEVSVLISRRRGSVVVAVGDNGPGIPPEAVEHLFSRFRSGNQRTGRAHYGLGLALAHDVANRHGGHVHLVSSAVGAVFELVLPALADQG